MESLGLVKTQNICSEVFPVVTAQIKVFQVVPPCSLVGGCQCSLLWEINIWGAWKWPYFLTIPLFLLWHKTILRSWKGSSLLTVNFPPVTKSLVYTWEGLFSYLTFTLAWTRIHHLTLLWGSERLPSLQPVCTTKTIPQFNLDDVGSMFLWSIDIYLQDYTVSQPRRRHSEHGHLFTLVSPSVQ
jgi:hypothetical protein